MVVRRVTSLPEDCWEHVFKLFLNQEGDHQFLQSLSMVSKLFLSMTSRYRVSLTISNQTLPFLPRLLQRFTNLTSLNISCFSGDRNTLLYQISCFPLQLKSLNLSNHPTIPMNGLRVFSQKITTLTSLICSNIGHIRKTDLSLIANCFPLLEELDLRTPKFIDLYEDFEIRDFTLALPKLRKVNLSGIYYINDSSIFHLCKNCKHLEEIVMIKCECLTHTGIALALRERPTLKSFAITIFEKVEGMVISLELINSLRSLKCLSNLDLSFSRISDELLSSLAAEHLPLKRIVLGHCSNYSYAGIFNLLYQSQFLQHLDLQNATVLNDYRAAKLSSFLINLKSINFSYCWNLTEKTLFALVKSCPFLDEIRMEYTSIGKLNVEKYSSLMDFVVEPPLKSLHLSTNPWLNDESIKTFASIFPNLQLLDISSCRAISDGIVEVLRRSSKIKHLNLTSCSKVNLHGINFQIPKLEVLKLSMTKIDDETLDVISRSCCGLLQLDLKQCLNITKKGVKQIVENCKQLREINLQYCSKIDVDF
ncbi:F-box/LRR-repeat protein 3-like [Vicia villosa]|uniref:F-box/LRR-repeat protein 3-like n=1 Tax=Vicia villosa TaxID=3911 RepID=UPI00273C8B66|nr:F-box/LRR-repeat protein 3-like [Vicia villosa]